MDVSLQELINRKMGTSLPRADLSDQPDRRRRTAHHVETGWGHPNARSDRAKGLIVFPGLPFPSEYQGGSMRRRQLQIIMSLLAIVAAGPVAAQIANNPIPAPVEKRGLAVEIVEQARLPDTRGNRPADQDVKPAGWARINYVRDLPDGRGFADNSRGFLYRIDSNNQPQVYANLAETFPLSVYNRLSSGYVPALPGKGRDLRIHDTATNGLVTLDPGPVARIYVCGITPYDATHMGHAATYIAFDLVQRVWLDTKRQVHYVQNVTDVDDPLLERAEPRRHRLGRARRAGDRALPRGHDRAADAAAAALHRCRRGDTRHRAARRAAPGRRRRLRARRGRLLLRRGRPALRRGVRPRRRRDAAALRRARRRPGPPRQEEPARPDALDGRP